MTMTPEQAAWFQGTFDASGRQRRPGRCRASATWSAWCWRRCSPRATCCWRTPPAPARRASPRRSRRPCRARSTRIQFTPDLLPSRRHRRDDLRPEHAHVRVPPRPDVRVDRAGGRDQPRLAEDAVGAARGHGGVAGHRRRRGARGRPPVPRDRHAEPDRAGRHVPAARGAARPLPDQDVDRLPRPRRRPSRSSPGPRSATRPRSSPPVITTGAVADMADLAAAVHVEPAVLRYIAELAEATRADPAIRLGVSVRGAMAMVRIAKVWAAAQGRHYVLPDDVKALVASGVDAPPAAGPGGRVRRHHRRDGPRPRRRAGPGPAGPHGGLTPMPVPDPNVGP